MKISDFGISEDFSEETDDYTDSRKGTIAYQSPEIYNRKFWKFSNFLIFSIFAIFEKYFEIFPKFCNF